MFYCVRVLGSSLNIAFSRIFREKALLAKVSGNEKYEKNKRRINDPTPFFVFSLAGIL